MLALAKTHQLEVGNRYKFPSKKCYSLRRKSVTPHPGRLAHKVAPSYKPLVSEARMRNLSLTVKVPDDRRVVVQLPDDVPAGEVRLSLFIHDGGQAKPSQPRTLKLPELHFESWPEDFPLRRSDLYDDDGR